MFSAQDIYPHMRNVHGGIHDPDPNDHERLHVDALAQDDVNAHVHPFAVRSGTRTVEDHILNSNGRLLCLRPYE